MEFACSPSRDGGPLHISPTHPHHINANSAIRKLRRSMSKSPSKKTFFASKSLPASPVSPLSAGNSESPLKNVSNMSNLHDSDEPTPCTTPIATTRQLRPSLKRSSVLQRTRPLSRSPMRRALSDSSDQGNGTPASSQSQGEGQENQPAETMTPRESFLADAKYATPFKSGKEVTAPLTLPVRSERDAFAVQDWMPAKSSPLKRSDGFMNLDSGKFDSPSAKRRSILGVSRQTSFDIPRDHTATSPPGSDEARESDDEHNFDTPVFRSPVTSRNFSHQKHQLQHRASDKAATSRFRRSVEFSSNSPNPSIRSRPRSSLDSALTNASHESASNEAEIDLFRNNRSFRQQPHPLSRVLSPTSPTPARPDDGLRQGEPLFDSPAGPSINFAKSLPIGALRPQLQTSGSRHRASNDPASDDTPFATPNYYKIARPDPAAFRSTGLISKRHRNPDELPPPPSGIAGMPDTPCKKVPPAFAYSPSPGPSVSIAQTRFAQPEFGTPSKPFNPNTSRPTPSSFGRTANIFGSSCYGHERRRTSFASLEGEEFSQSPHGNGESQSSNEELPPTPTKHIEALQQVKPSSLRSSIFGRRPSMGPGTFAAPSSIEAQNTEQDSTAQQSWKSSGFGSNPPQTPADAFPDPSGLSISPRSPVSPLVRHTWSNRPPETPTAHREARFSFTVNQPAMTPSNHSQVHDVDPVLISKFKKVEWHARGTFSEVYRVYQPAESMTTKSYFSPSTGSKSFQSQTPRPDKVFIVKKSKYPHHSVKLRQKKLQEVSIMAALGKNDHVVHLIDSWEAHHYLYIQTEFCEEGSLDVFLQRTGHRGRLDDFRIWKILIELSLGVKHIHDSGFLHLDLKPANVFIDFGGVLKIGDFGHASEWPAPENADGEGDRRYMGPDLLQGSMDKPADVFALGMMMFEIAGNCVPPDNGVSWHKLRSGDWSGLPSLTSGSSNSIYKDQDSQDDLLTGHQTGLELGNLDAIASFTHTPTITSPNLFGYNGPSLNTSTEEFATQPPAFMLDPSDPEALDAVVYWMMAPMKEQRPVIDQVLDTWGVRWVNERRRAGAVVFEGVWGPENHVLKGLMAEDEDREDAEMLDV